MNLTSNPARSKFIRKLCVFCGEPAIALYAMSDGCICRPNDREQLLCAQHENRMTPLGTAYMLEDYANAP